MQKVAEIIPPLSPKSGLAARGSTSITGALLFPGALKLILRRISALDVAPAAASLGDCAVVSIVSRSFFKSAVKYEDVAVSCDESYSPNPIPGVTGILVTDGRRPG